MGQLTNMILNLAGPPQIGHFTVEDFLGSYDRICQLRYFHHTMGCQSNLFVHNSYLLIMHVVFLKSYFETTVDCLCQVLAIHLMKKFIL